MSLRVIAVPVLSDNVSYLVSLAGGDGAALAVDVADADATLAAAAAAGLRVTAVASTHWHDDHTGGNAALAARVPGLRIYGGSERVAARTDAVAGGETLELAGVSVRVIAAPGHTADSMLYAAAAAGGAPAEAVFTGDTLFVGGCGRLFEGKPEQMWKSLEAFRALPPTTRVYDGHNYRKANFRFAASVAELKSDAAFTAAIAAGDAAAVGRTPPPPTVAEEMAHNVFLKAAEPAVQAALGASGAAAAFAALRARKDVFK